MLQQVEFFDNGKYPTNKKESKRRLKRAVKSAQERIKNHLELVTITPKTENQKRAFDFFNCQQHLVMHGSAGTGKTFLSLYLALRDTMYNKEFRKVYIVRSAVASREVGFMPGNLKQKAEVFEAPYYAICTELFGRSDAYEVLKQKGFIEFITTSFVRGITLNDCVVILDEVQNLTYQEIDSVITRVGENCRLIVCGDLKQDDLTFNKSKEVSGFKSFLRVASNMPYFSMVGFGPQDICRSDFVKSYILAKESLGL